MRKICSRHSLIKANQIFLCGLAITFLITTAGCISSKSQRGVENIWRQKTLPLLEKGKTTQSDILDAMGPPSQIIPLGEKVVFYYLHELDTSRTLIFIVYNQTRDDQIYDRAIFFFDQDGILIEYAFSKEKLPYEYEEDE